MTGYGLTDESFCSRYVGESLHLVPITKTTTAKAHHQTTQPNLHFAQARMYNPTMRRFVSPDPIQGWITNPQSLNLYIFVLNNPLRWVDPLGLTPQQPNSNVGLRDFAEAAGATVGWNEGTRHASVTHNGRTEYFYIGDHTVIDGRIQIDPRELGWLMNTGNAGGGNPGSSATNTQGASGSNVAGSGSMQDWMDSLSPMDFDHVMNETAGMSQSEAFRFKNDMRSQHLDAARRAAERQQSYQGFARDAVFSVHGTIDIRQVTNRDARDNLSFKGAEHWEDYETGNVDDFRNFLRNALGKDVQFSDWGGGNNTDSRTRGAYLVVEDIANWLVDHPGSAITIIGFSHGGNVAIEAISMLYVQGIDIQTLITIATPVRSDYQLTGSNVGQHVNVFSRQDSSG